MSNSTLCFFSVISVHKDYIMMKTSERMGEGKRQWSHGEGPTRHVYEAPSRVQEVFQALHNYTRERGLLYDLRDPVTFVH